jgi:hypothetical protein
MLVEQKIKSPANQIDFAKYSFERTEFAAMGYINFLFSVTLPRFCEALHISSA